jgi:hypothetical protein
MLMPPTPRVVSDPVLLEILAAVDALGSSYARHLRDQMQATAARRSADNRGSPALRLVRAPDAPGNAPDR